MRNNKGALDILEYKKILHYLYLFSDVALESSENLKFSSYENLLNEKIFLHKKDNLPLYTWKSD